MENRYFERVFFSRLWINIWNTDFELENAILGNCLIRTNWSNLICMLTVKFCVYELIGNELKSFGLCKYHSQQFSGKSFFIVFLFLKALWKGIWKNFCDLIMVWVWRLWYLKLVENPEFFYFESLIEQAGFNKFLSFLFDFKS